MIDFGLSKQYINPDGSHISMNYLKGLIGTARYASINAHFGFEQGRRDDIESVCYLMVYLAKGTLPWINI